MESVFLLHYYLPHLGTHRRLWFIVGADFIYSLTISLLSSFLCRCLFQIQIFSTHHQTWFSPDLFYSFGIIFEHHKLWNPIDPNSIKQIMCSTTILYKMHRTRVGISYHGHDCLSLRALIIYKTPTVLNAKSKKNQKKSVLSISNRVWLKCFIKAEKAEQTKGCIHWVCVCNGKRHCISTSLTLQALLSS